MSRKEKRPNLLTRFMRWVAGERNPFMGHDFTPPRDSHFSREKEWENRINPYLDPEYAAKLRESMSNEQ